MQGKRVKDSETVLTQITQPESANHKGTVHGGNLMKLIDEAGGVAAYRHARQNVTTAAIDRLDFHEAVHVGELVTVKASLHFAGRTSMEVGARVEAENLLTGKVRHVASARLAYVAIDAAGKPCRVPPLILESEDEIRRGAAAEQRRAAKRG